MLPRCSTSRVSTVPGSLHCQLRDLHVRFLYGAMTATGRGRVGTSNLRDHAVSAHSEAFRIATAALCTTARADLFDRGYFESCFAEALGNAFRGVYFAGRQGLMPALPASAVRFP